MVPCASQRTFGRRAAFVIGEHDPFVSADELKDFDVFEIAGAGHLVNIEYPDEFNAELLEFLAGV